MLIGFSGLAGAGKTTAICFLEKLGLGNRIYVGSFVTDEVKRRGMVGGPASEKHVRECLRRKNGMDTLARLALPTIQSQLETGHVALVDAIYCEEERSFYERTLGSRLLCIAVEASAANRARRLANRMGRPLTKEELETRDNYEITNLGLRQVMSRAHRQLSNDGTLDEFEQVLLQFVGDISL